MNKDRIIRLGYLRAQTGTWKGGHIQDRLYSPKGIAPCLPTVTGGGLTPSVLMEDATARRHLHGDAEAKHRSKRHEPRTDGITNTIATAQKDNLMAEQQHTHTAGRRLRIRKLTPTECLRLMDVGESDIEKMKGSGVSNSQLYKQAGNSIVVSCLYHIFRKMFVERDTRPRRDTQLEMTFV